MTAKRPAPYELLAEKSRAIHLYNSALMLLHWDQETYMPPGAIGQRSEQIAHLSELIHKERTSASFRAALGKLIHLKSGKLKGVRVTSTQKIALREWHKEFTRDTKLPTSFVKEFSQRTSEASHIWQTAKRENNFGLFAPFLKKIIEMCRQKADILGFEDHPYDALLEGYEPCMTSARVSTIFHGLKKELVLLMRDIAKKKPPENRFLHKRITDEKQREIGAWIMEALPMEAKYTRLDISSHPFSTALHPKDSRITTRHIPNAFMSNIFSILHEAGHSMYEMGLPAEHWGTPLCEAVSLSVHESQSRLWETLIGRSRPFWKHFYPELKKKLPAVLKNISFDAFYRAIHHVSPSYIRVEADEVTYCLHVILRFEIEKELIAGKLSVADLPDAWNERFTSLFGITPPDDTHGCLQDIHWSLGSFGYFPTYALGNLLAAQLFAAFEKKHVDWEERLERGELLFVREWLGEHVHRWGKTYDCNELAKRATGKALSEEAYCKYLKKKYKEIY